MSRSSARRLVEPDYWTCPHGLRVRPEPIETFGPEVADVCAAAGFAPDPQQELALDLIFAIKPDGSPATFEFCVVCSRQNLKTGLFLQAVIGWFYVLDVPEIVWSAHEMSTTRAAQRDLANVLLGAPSLRKRMLPQKNDGIYDANGEERIELLGPDGQPQTVWFKARTRDGGRGLAKPKLVLDEAFALRAAMMGALVPIMLAQKDPQMLLGSSPGKEDSDVLFDERERGRAGSSPAMTYLEWGNGKRPPCADPDCQHPKTGFTYGDPCVANRLELIEHANPTLTTGRITIETLANVRQVLTADEWFRECMGFWDEPKTDVVPPIFGTGKWEACAGEPFEQPEAPAVIGVAVSVDRLWASIAAASIVEVLEDPNDSEAEPIDRVFVAATDRREDVTWLVAELKRIQAKTDCAIVIDEKGPTKDLLKDLEDADVAVETVTLDEYAEACSRFFDKVRGGNLLHPSSTELDEAVAGATWRTVGDRGVWGRRKSATDVSMLEAATLAAYGAEKFAW
ncbi:hypothetical protein [Nocardioides sp. 503]|uniref:hypothetical protein n=1 Tax=Nocardioides sp. 503 TaxID=2508326 RepID=UPI00106F4CC4|nr:hypothetical protein [Nocardioides sp. 503]